MEYNTWLLDEWMNKWKDELVIIIQISIDKVYKPVHKPLQVCESMCVHVCVCVYSPETVKIGNLKLQSLR